MNRFVVETSVLRERASATPARTQTAPVVPAPTGSRRLGGAPAAPTGTLEAMQRWFVLAVTTPESEASAVSEEEAARLLTAGARLSALERLDVYRRGYHARLLECLADDYPVLAHALGEDTFAELARAYIARHPSSSPSLNFYGRHMAEFCRQHAPEPFARRTFAAELASLEWAVVEVIHAASAPPLTADALRTVPPDAWGEARLVPNGAARLLRFEYPVNRYFQAVRDATAVEIPGAEASATAVYRSGRTVWRMDLTPAMEGVLSALMAGEPLGIALGRAESEMNGEAEEAAAARVLAWFRDWVQSGLFSRVEVGGAPSS